ncbi:unnamed protein product [Cyclocybe aegerita]|uniref:Uncharacterized protein n=1 Tax=Cyclocybe aegerita TaxID=1973307 RepID=A0A8S0VXH2_CYCAE|nr:unnamed protein product [Cyclocybe aegerita]
MHQERFLLELGKRGKVVTNNKSHSHHVLSTATTIMASPTNADVPQIDKSSFDAMDRNSTAYKLIYYQLFREAACRQIEELNQVSHDRPFMVYWRSLDLQKQEMLMSSMLRNVAFQPDFDLNDVERQERVMSTIFLGELVVAMRKQEKRTKKKVAPRGNPLLRLAIEQSASVRQATIM